MQIYARISSGGQWIYTIVLKGTQRVVEKQLLLGFHEARIYAREFDCGAGEQRKTM